MNKEWLDCLMKMPILNYEEFKEKSSLETTMEVSSKFETVDYSWLSVVEKYLPFLKNTIEFSTPLLVDLEESKKNYENRFLYTLFNRLEEFLKKQYESILNQENSSDSSSLKVIGKSSLNNEEVMLDLSLTVTKKELDKKKNTTLQAKQRLEQIFDFLEPLKKGKFMNALEGIPVVRSPIRRTGLLVTHENYKKLLELFEFLDSYAMLEKALNVKEKKKNYDLFTIPYFMSYQLFSESNSFAPKDEEFLKKYLEGIVRQFVEESTVDEKSFKKMLNKLFEEEYAKKKTREKNIQQIFMKSFDTHQKQVKDAIRSLKG